MDYTVEGCLGKEFIDICTIKIFKSFSSFYGN